MQFCKFTSDNHERCLSKSEEFCRDFGPLGRKFRFFAGSQQNVKKTYDKERETVGFLTDVV